MSRRSERRGSSDGLLRFAALAGHEELAAMLRALSEREPSGEELRELIDARPFMRSIEELGQAWYGTQHEKLGLLADLAAQHHIAAGPGAGWTLALELAEQYHPLFRRRRRGRPATWTATARLLLAADVHRHCPELLPTDALPPPVARQLAKREPWRTVVTRWGRGTLGADPAEALESAYASISIEERCEARTIYRQLMEPGAENPLRRVREQIQRELEEMRARGIKPHPNTVSIKSKGAGEFGDLPAADLFDQLLAALALKKTNRP